MTTVRDYPVWDERKEYVTVPCLGGPWDGETFPMAPGQRTVRAWLWGRCYYEVQVVREAYTLVWRNGGAFGHELPHTKEGR